MRTGDRPILPAAVQSHEQARQLAARIVHESGVGRDALSPGSAKFLAHQMLADHVIETQRQEVERLYGEVAKLQQALNSTQHATPPAAAKNRLSFRSPLSGQSFHDETPTKTPPRTHSPRSTIPSPPGPADYDPHGAPPAYTESMVRPDSGLYYSNKPMPEPTANTLPRGSRIFPDNFGAELPFSGAGVSVGQPGVTPIRSSMRQSIGGTSHANYARQSAAEEDLLRQLADVLHQAPGELKGEHLSTAGACSPAFIHVPNFAKLALDTINHHEAQDRSVPTNLPGLQKSQHLSPSARTRASGILHSLGFPGYGPSAGFEAPPSTTGAAPRPGYPHLTQGDSRTSTAPSPFAGKTVPDSAWGAVGGDVLAVVRELRDKQREAEAEKAELQRRLAIAAGGGADDGAVFETPVEPLANFMDGRFTRLAIPPPTPPEGQFDERPVQKNSHVFGARQRSQPRVEEDFGERRHGSSTGYSVVQGSMANPGCTLLTADALPEGWKMYRTAEGRPYYYNTVTAKSHWKRPTAPAGKPLMINININVDKRKKRAAPEAFHQTLPQPLSSRPDGFSSFARHSLPVETIVQDTPYPGRYSQPFETDRPAVEAYSSHDVPTTAPHNSVSLHHSAGTSRKSQQHAMPTQAPLLSAPEAPDDGFPIHPNSAGDVSNAGTRYSQRSSRQSVPLSTKHRGEGDAGEELGRDRNHASSNPGALAESHQPPPHDSHPAEAEPSGAGLRVDDRTGSPVIAPQSNSTTVVGEGRGAHPASHSQLFHDSAPSALVHSRSTGSSQQQRCIACGTTLAFGATYCHNCGWRAVAPDAHTRSA
ncbi:hypothetical protein DIPPA_17839 [Diplonema papillatum]|nr:hypothetical protein DIPPA_17839 [Diplonema papillatum]KAJ9456735.1 hypothetical protein DIPPA_17839 [Diplonema papillatum]